MPKLILLLISARDASGHIAKSFGSGRANTRKLFARRAGRERDRPNHEGVKEKPSALLFLLPLRRRREFAEAPTRLPPISPYRARKLGKTWRTFKSIAAACLCSTNFFETGSERARARASQPTLVCFAKGTEWKGLFLVLAKVIGAKLGRSVVALRTLRRSIRHSCRVPSLPSSVRSPARSSVALFLRCKAED